MEDERQFANHLKDLANKAYNQNIFTFTGFCGLMETDVYERCKKDLNFIKSTKFGGISDSSLHFRNILGRIQLYMFNLCMLNRSQIF